MKICFVADTIGVIGGQQKILTIIANSLAEKNIDVSILFTETEKLSKNFKYPLNSKIKVHWQKETRHGKYDYLFSRLFKKSYQRGLTLKNKKLSMNMLFPLRERKAFIDFFSNNIFDVVIGVAPYASAIIGLISNNISSKTIGWFHNSYERYFEYKDNLYNLKEFYSIAFEKLDKRIVLTKSAMNRYTNEFNLDFIHIYNPLTFETSKKSKLEKQKIIFVGRIFYATKGLDLLVEILKKLKDINNNFEVDIIGDGPDMKRFLNDINKKNISSIVNVVGESNNIIEHYLENSIFISTSRVEGFGLVLTEAMECGLPVVSFATEGPSEIIIQNESGFLIDIYDTDNFTEKLNTLLKNKDLRKRMGKNAIARASDFSLDNITDKWIKEFKTI